MLSQIKQTDAMSVERKDWKSIFDYNLYGEPSMSLFGRDPAYKSDVVFVLDGSGSMVSPEPGKWEAAVDAAVLFYDLMKALRYPAFDDEYGSVVFRWLYPDMIDGTTTVPPAGGMNDITVALDVSDFIPDYTPDPPYSTPMGVGLRLAADQFDLHTEDALYTDKMIILLSDGKHNTGSDPLEDVIYAPDWPSGVRVHTVGLGEDDIEPETIEEIAGATFADYRISPSPREMEGFFCEILCNMSWKLQNVPVASDGSVTIDGPKAVFIVVWDDPASPVGFQLQPPGGGARITPASNPYAPQGLTVSYHAPEAGETHAFYTCDNIPAELMGDWQFASITVPISDVLMKAILDPAVIADFEIENVEHTTGRPILFTARITANGKPLTGVSGVYAELKSSPSHSAADLMSENSPSTKYPARPAATSDVTPRKHYLTGVMQKLGITSIFEYGGPRVYMKDDGVHPDSKANDGIYTGAFTDTDEEGSYTFNFRAQGEAPGGDRFDRGETLSEYVSFAPDPGYTEIVVVSTMHAARDIDKTMVNVKPRNAAGSYLGPFRGEKITIVSDIGTVEPQYTDNMDGSYTFTVVHPTGIEPTISVAVGDVLVADRMVCELPEPSRFAISIHSGVTTPLDKFNNDFDPSVSFSVDFEYRLMERLAAVLFVGYDDFKSGSPLVDDMYWLRVSINGVYELTSHAIRPYISAGGGLYIPEDGSTEGGINAGVGVHYTMTPRLILEAGADYHHVFTDGDDVMYSVQHVGLIYRF